jgi:hypothetical protein
MVNITDGAKRSEDGLADRVRTSTERPNKLPFRLDDLVSVPTVNHPVGMRSIPFSVFVDVCRSRQEIAKQGLLLETTGLRDTEKTEILTGASLTKRTGNFPLDCQVTNRSLRSVVVPRNVIIFNEREKRFLIALKPFPISSGRVPCGGLSGDRLSVENIDVYVSLGGRL